ncbi:MAG TPA: Na+/H+ antiporter NhaA [Planctomycetota bacterium]|nr:Na+/H+ antiporter NhaA [Planctomycetota bacterium]
MRSQEEEAFPREPIHRITGPLERFLHVEAASGAVLLVCAAAALAIANSDWAEAYLAFWEMPLGLSLGEWELEHSLRHWVNDGLMAIFFFVIGLEVKREIALGELRSPRRAALPLAGALGGMLVPAGVYLLLQGSGPARDGWGIPMATDIAFVVGCMAILGPRIPPGLRVFLLSLAIADDIGAVLAIAIGYTDAIQWIALGLGLAGILIIALLARMGVRSLLVYTLFGTAVWFAFHESGVHATIAGVILGLQTPASTYLERSRLGRLLDRARGLVHGEAWEEGRRRVDQVRELRRATREAVSPLEYIESVLHPWVGFAIMPIFALANAGVPFRPTDLLDPVAVAVAAGLVVGKPLGVIAFAALAVRLRLTTLPEGVSWGAVAGAAFLAGIGFTMALFIAGLALEGPELDAAKVGVLSGSVVAAGLGAGVLVWRLPKPSTGAR